LHEVQEKVVERALLVGIDRPDSTWPVTLSLEELSRLVDTAGALTVATTTQKLSSPNPKTFIGSGKALEIAEICTAENINIVVFDDELTPSQQSNLERIVGKDVKVIDRTALILDIFALHAKTKEGRLQVKLAQNQYLYPRLRGMWAHLASNRMGGGVGSRFGEGESQLEVDRRIIRNRITSIRKELDKLSKIRGVQREKRYESSTFKIALAGYTNAGKSSLINAISGSEVESADKLFATLDSTTRKFKLDEGREVSITDTVGFIQKLPTTLVEAFKSTLDEINGADLILHVVDASSAQASKHIQAVEDVLMQIKADKIPVIMVFNKIDLLDNAQLSSIKERFPNAEFVSAHTSFGLDDLKVRLSKSASALDSRMSVIIPFSEGNLTSIAHKRCEIISEQYSEAGTALEMRVPASLVGKFKKYSY
jgi:GTP-binding protein HflX